MTHTPRIAVFGLWHLGCVTAASLAQESYHVCGLDTDRKVIEDLQAGNPPIFEPGLKELITAAQVAGYLKFTADYEEALREADVLWVTFDTPIDEEDKADVNFVHAQLDAAFDHIRTGTIVIISSQVPVGFTDSLRKRWLVRDAKRKIIYCVSPENLRLGKALQTFRPEDRIVVGIDGEEGRELVQTIMSKFCPRLEWMSVRSAEMTKHALNSFLAVSVAMTNEIARICERTGADAKQVERGLKSERRIGPRAYVAPGGPFAGGTLARDLRFLVQLGAVYKIQTPLLSGALSSNDLHKNWLRDVAIRLLKDVREPAQVAILGLTYKSGTDTLRRSEAVSLGFWLREHGARVIFHDPVVHHLPEDLADKFQLTDDLRKALTDSDLLVVLTDSPIYRKEVHPLLLAQTMRRRAVIDQSRFLAAQLENFPGIEYSTVGKPTE